MTSKAHVAAVPQTHRTEWLDAATIKEIHERTLRVLERTGVKIASERVRSALAAAGANVDSSDGRVRFPAELVEEKRAIAPREYVLAARDPSLDVRLDGSRSYLTADGCMPEILDLDSGKRRPSTKDDLIKITRLSDAMPQIGLQWQPVSANDTPAASRSVHELHAQFPNTTKHIQSMTVIDPDAAAASVAMARAVAGGDRELRERPILSNFQCSISPLAWEEGPLDAMLIFAEAGVPMGFCSMPLACATSPGTVAGTLLSSNAEILAGVVALQTMVPGAPSFYVSYATTMDLHSGAMALGWGPEDLVINSAVPQLARFYGLPCSAATMGTGSKRTDWQAGVQNGLSLFASLLGGQDIMTGAGGLYADRVFSYEHFLLDAEIYDICAGFWSGATFNDDSFGEETIDEVGPEGHFLAQPHTLAHMREFWQSRFFDRSTWEDWEAGNVRDASDLAREQARSLIEEHEPVPLDSGVESELLHIVESYESRALSVA